MKKHLIAFIILYFTQYSLAAQLTRTNWMAGGNAAFTTAKYKDPNDNYSTRNFSLSPTIGYFFADRFAAGLRVNYSNYELHTTQIGTGLPGEGHDVTVAAGPFARYYLLQDLERPVNLLVEGNYAYGYSSAIDSKKYFLNRYSFAAGPAYYLNNSIAIEFTIGYVSTTQYQGTTAGLEVRIGFQIHLEKEKK